MSWDKFKADQAILRRSVKTHDPETYAEGNPHNEAATYVAVCQNGSKHGSPCTYNPGEKLAFDIEDIDYDMEESGPIVSSYIVRPNGEIAREGVRFEF
jgi:hypothetical protein